MTDTPLFKDGIESHLRPMTMDRLRECLDVAHDILAGDREGTGVRVGGPAITGGFDVHAVLDVIVPTGHRLGSERERAIALTCAHTRIVHLEDLDESQASAAIADSTNDIEVLEARSSALDLFEAGYETLSAEFPPEEMEQIREIAAIAGMTEEAVVLRAMSLMLDDYDLPPSGSPITA